MARILVVDDDENICSAFQQFLERDGHTPLIASNAEDAVKTVVAENPDLVIMDIRMPGTDGLAALHRIKQLSPHTDVIIMTAFGTSQTSIEAMRLGAFEYLNKPFGLEEVREVIDKALETQSLSRKAGKSAQDQWDKYSGVSLVGKSPRMQEAYKRIGLLSTNNVPALLSGEQGVGKRLVAYTIHFNSSRKAKPFLAVNCSTLPNDEVETEIFGSEAAASGAAPYLGKIERAAGGTVFIEEIHDLPRTAQDRLLRYLRDRGVERVGGAASVAPDTRVLAAATVNLADSVRQGQFNLELFELLRVISIDLPPLRDRLEDIPDLVDHFLRRNNEELNRTLKGVDARLLKVFEKHPWPGNVAELEHAIKRACILARGDVITEDDVGDLAETSTLARDEVETELDAAVRQTLQQRLIDRAQTDTESVFHDIVGKVETTLVREALTMTGGNQVKAAEILGLNRTTLRKKMNLEP